MKKLLVGIVAILALAVCAHADITIGTANGSNCIPWSCRSIDNGNYEQIYSSSAFSGDINIGDIEFYNTFSNNGGGSQGIATLSFSLYLAVTSMTVPDGSIPSDVLFGSYSLNGGLWTFGNKLTFNGTPFAYDPTKGNLELIMVTTGGSNPNSGVFTFFDAESGGPFSRWCRACGSDPGYGLVTGFSTAATPEPGSLIQIGSGVLALAGTVRRKLMR